MKRIIDVIIDRNPDSITELREFISGVTVHVLMGNILDFQTLPLSAELNLESTSVLKVKVTDQSHVSSNFQWKRLVSKRLSNKVLAYKNC